MAWTPSDFALVISSSATAITALSGVVLPIWLKVREKRTHLQQGLYARAAEAISFCVENIEEVVRHKDSESMRLAYLEAGHGIPDEEERKVGASVEREFERNFRMVQMLAEEVGVDFTDFRTKEAFATVPKSFNFTDGHLSEVKHHEEIFGKEGLKNRLNAIDAFVSGGAKLRKGFRAKLGVGRYLPTSTSAD